MNIKKDLGTAHRPEECPGINLKGLQVAVQNEIKLPKENIFSRVPIRC